MRGTLDQRAVAESMMDLERNGASFRVCNSSPTCFVRRPRTERSPTVEPPADKEGELQVTRDGEAVDFALDQASGHANTGSDHDREVRPDSPCLAPAGADRLPPPARSPPAARPR